MYFWKDKLKELLRGDLQNSREKIRRIDFRSGLGDSAWLIHGLIRSMKPAVCVEIGSARGYSASVIGLALKENGSGKLYAIDPHMKTEWNDTDSIDSHATLKANLAEVGVASWVEVIKSSSVDAAAGWTHPIDFLFIDGDHSYEGVKRDWDLFLPHMKPFGFVAFHDTLWDLLPPGQKRDDMGVPKFVDDLRRQGYPILTVERDFGVSLVQPKINGIALSQ